MQEIRFVGGVMDGKRGRDEVAPSSVTCTAAGAARPDVYVQSGVDEDGTLIYRKK